MYIYIYIQGPGGGGVVGGEGLKGFHKTCAILARVQTCHSAIIMGWDLAWDKILPRGLGTISIPGTPHSAE